MLDLQACRIFARVVDEQSFSAAARALDLSLPAVSKQVARLERQLDARLLHRTTRRLSLTEAGAAFHAHCLRLLDDARAAEEAVTHLHAAPRGLLRVSAPVSFTANMLAPLLPAFMARHPEVHLELDASDRLVDLAEDAYDLAIRLTAQPPDTLAARPLRPLRRVLCAAPDYLERHGTPRRPDDLARHNCLVYPQGESLGNWAFEIEGRSVQMPVRGTVRSNSTETLLQLARQGVGIVAMRDYTVTPDLAAARLVEVLRAFAPASTAQLYALYLPNRHLPPKARVFIDFLAEQFATSAG